MGRVNSPFFHELFSCLPFNCPSIYLLGESFSCRSFNSLSFGELFLSRGSILNFYLSMVAPIVSTTCYLYFLILVSVLSLPLSVILSFIFNNISVLKHFWFLIVRLPDEGVSHDFINVLAIIINFIQTAVLLLKARVISILFLIKNYSLKPDKFFRVYNSDILMLIRIAQICCQFFSYLNYYLIITDIVQTLLILSGNVLENPGPTDCDLKFFHWNLDSLTAHDKHPSVTGSLKALPPLFFQTPKKFCMLPHI